MARSALAGGIDGRVLDVERKAGRGGGFRDVLRGAGSSGRQASRRRADEGRDRDLVAGGPGSRRQGARGFHLLCVGR